MSTGLEAMLAAQRSELTEYHIYRRLAVMTGDPHNARVLRDIAADELRHHDFWKERTRREVRPRRWTIVLYVTLARLLGPTFALKLMERGEDLAQRLYAAMDDIEGVRHLVEDEERHERELIDLLNDEPLQYAGSIVLGLNDALVELTGALAGFSLALGEGRLVATAGLVTGIAASLSMAASEYLSSRSEEEEGRRDKSPLKAAAYTGAAYVVAVILLILPYFLVDGVYTALAMTLGVAVGIIAVFNFYIAVARDLRFWPRFAEMVAISMGVAAVTFGLAWVVRHVLGVDV